MVNKLTNKYHLIALWLLQITHKQVYHAVCKKQCEGIVIDIITWNLLPHPQFYPIIIKKKPNLVHSVSHVNKSKKIQWPNQTITQYMYSI